MIDWLCLAAALAFFALGVVAAGDGNYGWALIQGWCGIAACCLVEPTLP